MDTCRQTSRLVGYVFTLLLLSDVTCSAGLQLVSKGQFQSIINDTKYVLVMFFYDVETCPRCAEAERELKKVNTHPDLFEEEIRLIKCEDPGTAVSYGVTTVPQIIFFRDGVPALFETPHSQDGIGKFRSDDLEEWIEVSQMVAMKTLDDDTFEHLTQAATGATTGDWLVIFYSAKCSTNLAAIEGAGVKLRHTMNVAKVNMDDSPGLKKRFKIKECPTTYYFRFGKMYHYYSEEPDQYHVSSLISFVSSWYKNVKAQPVLVDPSAFDILTETIADSLKEQLNGPNRQMFLLITGSVLAAVSFIVAMVTCRRTRRDNIKSD